MKQFEIHLANLDPTVGAEINKTRPVIIVSPNELNGALKTVIVAPITSQHHGEIPFRTPINLNTKTNYVALDQMRALDKSRLYKRIVSISKDEAEGIQNTLIEMFS